MNNPQILIVELDDYVSYDDYAKLFAELAAVEKQNRILELKNAGTLANNLCCDCRDKQVGKPCLGCTIQTLQRRLDNAAKLLAANRALVDVYRAAVAAYTFVDPRATTFDLNAEHIEDGDVKRKLGDALQAASAALSANEAKP